MKWKAYLLKSCRMESIGSYYIIGVYPTFQAAADKVGQRVWDVLGDGWCCYDKNVEYFILEYTEEESIDDN